MKSAKGQRMTDTLHLESITISIWLELKSLVSLVAAMLVIEVLKMIDESVTNINEIF